MKKWTEEPESTPKWIKQGRKVQSTKEKGLCHERNYKPLTWLNISFKKQHREITYEA